MNQLNRVIEFLEAHLLEDVDINLMAKELGLSTYHLKRTFSFFYGMTIPEYVKKRRLSLANGDLLQGASVTETTFKYGYQSVEGFSRAFKEFAGMTPSEVYPSGFQKVFLPFQTEIHIKGGFSMDFKIVNKPAFNLVGVSKQVPIQFEGENQEIVALAQSITKEQTTHLHQLMDLAPNQVVNASYNFDDQRMSEQGNLQHLIGVVTSQANPYSDFEQVAVPELTWAIFPNQGPFPETLQTTWGTIYADWLPNSGYQLVEAPEISFSDFSMPETKRYSEIWIAVTKV